MSASNAKTNVWVPPPLAASYQILVFQGRAPKQSPRELAFDFPRYFNEDLAPDLAAWWTEMLANGTISGDAANDVKRALADFVIEEAPIEIYESKSVPRDIRGKHLETFRLAIEIDPSASCGFVTLARRQELVDDGTVP